MKTTSRTRRMLLCTISGLAFPAMAHAQASSATPAPSSRTAASADDQGIADIIVTAQKREQSINNVGLSIIAASGDELQTRGITSTDDLVKIVPGFFYSQSQLTTPIYTLRGVGLNDAGIAAAPAVSVYVDQVSLAYPVMTTGASLDLERVEVLKGPQGTLFGQNSTGGAINYIAAKPTDTLAAGGSLTYERFGKMDATGYVSGPISANTRARLALRAVEGGAWQYSVTRPQDKVGSARQLMGRLLVDIDASDRLTLHLGANGFSDRSDAVQPQFDTNFLNITAAGDPNNPFAVVNPARFNFFTNPASPGFNPAFLPSQALTVANLTSTDPAVAAGALAFLGQPNSPRNNRAAEFGASLNKRLDRKFGQLSLRAEYKLSDTITLTSITAGDYLSSDVAVDQDATPARVNDVVSQNGSVRGFAQELRLAGDTSRLNWVVGANYDYHRSVENAVSSNEDNPGTSINGIRFDTFLGVLENRNTTMAVFGNAEYKLTDSFSVQGALRYTKNRQKGAECISDVSGSLTQPLSRIFTGIQAGLVFFGVKNTPIVPISGGQCVSLTALPDATPTLTPALLNINDNNVSWRFGVTNKFDSGLLLYANASRGYKAALISEISAAFTTQFAPTRQERLDAYEVGFKAPLFDRRVQLNGAGFYYDYKDKQLRSRIIDPIFGQLEQLTNVPKTRIWGIEGEIVAQPIGGLRLSANGTYLNSKILNSNQLVFNQAGVFGNFAGSKIPFTAEFSGVADVQYEWEVGSKLRATVGSTLRYQGSSASTFRTATLLADESVLPAYTLLDLRAGIGAPDDSWKLQVFGRNVTNKYYYDGAFYSSYNTFRYTGRPAVYGITFSAKIR